MFFGPRIKTITTAELAERIAAAPVVLIDVREPHEFVAGHVPRAVNVPLGEIRARASEFDASAETYVICQSGHRSVKATKQLTKYGFSNVANVGGGTSAWTGQLKR
ncbi:MAG: rhodanese-like domain-containing protein [Coriobacteriia bacterium]|nr:rhodanese-like domain-containing protein [Coriobacteriia bacterium]